MTNREIYNTLLEKAKRYCAYQERCVFDLKVKLREWKAEASMTEEIFADLKEDGFIDEMRFAKVFAGGKFRIKKWGRNKIRAKLRMKNIPEQCIETGLLEINEDDYVITLKKLLDQKKNEFVDPNMFSNRNKIYTFAVTKGYERELILKYL